MALPKTTQDKKAIVYIHTRLDTSEVFYVGISNNEKRPFDKRRRNSFWKNIVKKTEYKVDFIYENLSWDEACEIEIQLIKKYGRRDKGLGTLVNLTDGGDGTLGVTPHNKGKFGIFKHSDETRANISLNNLGKKLSKESIAKGLATKKGFKHSEETRKIMSSKRVGSLNSNAKTILDINTGVFYNSMNEIIELYDYKKPFLSMMLNGKRKNKTSFRYV